MMPTAAELLDRLDRVVDRRLRYEHEIALFGGRIASTRFARTGIHENTETLRLVAQARVALPYGGGARVATLRSSRVDEASLRALRDACAERALDAPVDPRFRDMLAAGFHASTLAATTNPRDPRTADSGPAWRAAEVARAIRPWVRHGACALTGRYTLREGGMDGDGGLDLLAIANLWDVRGIHTGTTAEFVCRAELPDGTTGWSGAWARARTGIDPAEVARQAVDLAHRNRNPERLAAGTYRVHLAPAAVAALLRCALPTFSAGAVREGRSQIRGGARPTLAAPFLSLIADPTHPDLQLRGFDGEGVPTRPVPLIEEGLQRDLVTSRADVEDESLANGYGPAQPSHADALPRGVRLVGGTGTPDELLERANDALVVARLDDVRVIDPVHVHVVATPRHGFYELRRGQPVRALYPEHLRASVFELLRNAVDASAPVRVGEMLAPALLVEGVRWGHA